MDFDEFKAINDERRNVGIMSNPMTIGKFKNESCGDDYAIYIKIEGDRIADSSFTTAGCGFGLAAFSLAADWIRGKTPDEAERISEGDIEAGIGGFPERRRCYPQKSGRDLPGDDTGDAEMQSAGDISIHPRILIPDTTLRIDIEPRKMPPGIPHREDHVS